MFVDGGKQRTAFTALLGLLCGVCGQSPGGAVGQMTSQKHYRGRGSIECSEVSGHRMRLQFGVCDPILTSEAPSLIHFCFLFFLLFLRQGLMQPRLTSNLAAPDPHRSQGRGSASAAGITGVHHSCSLSAEISLYMPHLPGSVPVFKIPMCGQDFTKSLSQKQNSFNKQGFGRAQAYWVTVPYFPPSPTPTSEASPAWYTGLPSSPPE